MNKQEQLYKGIFWIRDDLPLEKSADYCVKIPCDSKGEIDQSLAFLMTAKSTLNHNHKTYWNEIMESSLKNGKPFDYYPRGRVEIRNSKVTIFLNPNIFLEEVKEFIVSQFNLRNVAIKKITMIADDSEHYKCHIDK